MVILHFNIYNLKINDLKKNKSFLIVHRYFYPENISAFANILGYLSKYFLNLNDKNKVDIVTISSKKFQRDLFNGYEERIKIIEDFSQSDRSGSFFLRIRNIFRLFFKSYAQINKKKYDYIILTSYPPFLPLMILFFLKERKSKIIFYVQDIQINYFKHKFLNNILLLSIKNILNSVDFVITLSEDMKETLIGIEKKFSRKNIFVLNNFTNVARNDVQTKSIKKKYDLIYAGSLGVQQQLLAFIKFFKDFIKTYPSTKFIIYGEGTEKKIINDFIVNQNLENNIFLRNYIPKSELQKELHSSKFVLVSIKSDIFNYAYPSKIIDSLTNGFPVIVTAKKDSKISSFINEHCLGSSIDINSDNIVDELDILRNLISESKNFSNKDIQTFASKKFGKDKYLDKFNEIFLQISKS